MSENDAEIPTDFDAARAESERLTAEIERYRVAYYSEATSLVSDAEYDALFHRLEAIERQFPELAGLDSPTQQVGAEISSSGFPSHEHAERMLSLDNVFTLEEFEEWAGKVRAAAGRDVRWLSELKIDGLARVEQRGADGDVVAEERLHREGIEAALKLASAVQPDLAPRRSAGLVVAHERALAVAGDVEPVDIAGDAEACVGNRDRRARIPRRLGVGFRLQAAERHFAKGARSGQDLIAIGKGAPRHHAGIVEGAPPDDGRRNRTLAFPIAGDGLRGPGHRRFDGLRVG